jgi:transcription elongation factor Elf1
VALKKKGRHYYGDSRADIRPELERYSKANKYPLERLDELSCPECGHERSHLILDEEAGAAVQCCVKCEHEVPLADSEEFLEEAELQQAECPCGNGAFEMAVGFAFYKGTTDVRWVYIGCRCPECGLTACYGDWKTP